MSAALGALLRDALDAARVPSGAAAVALDGRIVAAAHAGGAGPDTAFRGASLTKPLVATAFMRLAEAGTVGLDDRVRDHLPDFALADAAAADVVTLADLLSHRGGWSGDFIDLETDGLAEHVARMDVLEPLVAPGTTMSYSNAGFATLGRVLEVVTGERFGVALARLVLDPLGLTRTAIGAPAAGLTLATGHTAAGAPIDAPPLPAWTEPSGGVITTATDLMAFALAACDEAELTVPRADAIGAQNLGDAVALGWMTRGAGDGRMISHTGDMLGQHTVLVALPAARAGAAVMVDAAHGEKAAETVARRALRELGGLALPERAVAPPAPAARCAGASGRFESSLSWVTLDVGDDARASLVIERKPLLPGAEGTFRSTGLLAADGVLALDAGDGAGERVRVLADGDGDGRAAWLRVEGRLARRVA